MEVWKFLITITNEKLQVTLGKEDYTDTTY